MLEKSIRTARHGDRVRFLPQLALEAACLVEFIAIAC